MPPEFTYSFPFFIAAASSLGAGLLAFQRRINRGAMHLFWVCVCSAVWAVFEGVLYLGFDLETDMLATYAQYLGAMPLMPFCLLFTMTVFGFERWINRRMIILLVIITVAILLLTWTDPLHHLVYKNFYIDDSGVIPMRVVERGVLWWLIIVYQYLLALAIAVILLRAVVTSTRVPRAQAGVILAAVGVVWGVNIIHVSGLSPLPNADISPLAFIFVALAMAWGFYRYSLLDILPIAQTEIYRSLSDPILVLDDQDHILDLNPAAESLLNMSGTASIGRPVDRIFSSQPKAIPMPRDSRRSEVCLFVDGQERFFILRSSTIKNQQGVLIGRVIIFQDITERIRAERAGRENERLQGVLEMAGAVSHDLSQPVMAILGYAELMRIDLPEDDPLHRKTIKMAEQAEALSAITQQLVRITRYETKPHQGGRIIDIARASAKSD